MTRSERKWQLLMVANDGRIIPFKRIKGVALVLAALLILAVLACAVLAWQLTAERVRHGRTRDRLSNALQQAEHYKSEHELVAAELVLAEARMEKAGMPVSHRELRFPSKSKTIEGPSETEPPSKEPPEDTGTLPAAASDKTALLEAQETPEETVQPAPAVQTNASDSSGDDARTAPGQSETPVEKKVAAPDDPVVSLGDLTVKLDVARQILKARFRIKNNGPRSSPVAGRCVVVFKSERLKPAEWLALPPVTLTSGKPDGQRGQAFKIRRFKDMTAESAWQSDPTVFDTATVHVFDEKAQLLLVKDYPLDLPALPSAPAASPPVTTTSLPAQTTDPSDNGGDSRASVPFPPGGSAGSAPLPATDPSTVDDASLVDNGRSPTSDDSRSRF